MTAEASLRSEAEIIERIWSRLATAPSKGTGAWLQIGAGDDATVISGAPPARGGAARGIAEDWVLSCDWFIEKSHFLVDVHPPESVGYKALARATSDLAAMGASPRFFMLSLALPESRTGEWLDGFLAGMAKAAKRFGMILIGGDTSKNQSIVMNLTVGGVARCGSALTRSGAKVGDGIYVTGKLGAAQLGLELVLQGLGRKAQWKRFLAPHLYPSIQVVTGHWLAGENPGRRKIASAAIDTSDGLSTDLDHICRASGVGARILAQSLPTVAIPEALRKQGFDPIELALHGGEDYQLLFTAAGQVPRIYRGVAIARIGEIVALKGKRPSAMRGSESKGKSFIEIVDAAGAARPLIPAGWDHFRKTIKR
jgi:thiamine-monophosphate kinase